MRVAFIEDILRFSIPLGITSIAATLRESGHDVAVFVAGADFEPTLDRIEEYAPDALAFSVISGSHQGYYALARRAKERLGIPTIWGGPHPTFFPEIVELDWVDAVCRGEGEEAMRQLADGFDASGGSLPRDIPNFWVDTDGEIIRNPIRPRLRALDDLPYPARDLYYDQSSVLKQHGIRHFLAHRGCPYECTYCFNHGYKELYRKEAGDKTILTSRSPDSIVDEILWLKKRVPVRMVSFVDDVFTLNRRWTLEFAEVYGRRCRIPFSINARFDNVDDDLVRALSEAGLHLVYAGVESGNERIRNTVMKRRMSAESIYEGAALFEKYGVKLLTENVIGNPGETFEEAMETLRVNVEIRPEVANASIFAPYPKLEMTRYAIEEGYFDGDFDRLNSNYYYGSVLKFDKEEDLRKIVNLRCFFSLLSHHPHLLPAIQPLLSLTPNTLFRWFGDLVDGYYLKRCLAYDLSLVDFATTLRHFLTSYRQG